MPKHSFARHLRKVIPYRVIILSATISLSCIFYQTARSQSLKVTGVVKDAKEVPIAKEFRISFPGKGSVSSTIFVKSVYINNDGEILK